MISEVLKIGPHVTVAPVVHGSGDFAWEIRRLMLSNSFDCVAVPLPESFQDNVEQAILSLPTPSAVFQRDPSVATPEDWKPAAEPTSFDDDGEDFDEDADFDDADFENLDFDIDLETASYVPIDPCQPVIAALRAAMGDRIPRRFIDLETSPFVAHSRVLPDGYALKQLSIEKFAAAVAPFTTAPDDQQWRDRIAYMAWQLRQLSVDYKNILFVCSVLDWPWIRQAFNSKKLTCPAESPVEPTERFEVRPNSYYFLLGELPLITGLYEQARATLDDDENLSIDGVKELLLDARDHYLAAYKNRARKITPSILKQCLQYIRNLTLIDHRFSPQLVTIVTAAQQVAGDGYALSVLESAKKYPATGSLNLPEIGMSIDQAALPDGTLVDINNRLPGPPRVLADIKLIPKPDETQKLDWQQKWNPHSQCSWPAEDQTIENFRQTVFDRTQEVMGADLAKTEKFTTSIKDGIDIRDTVRNWYSGDIYVKVLPPNRGRLDCAVMLFDSPADPRDYAWRTTWFAEHKDESTLAFYATDFTQQPVGPGICLANYGGAMFLYPPVAIPDIWQDPRLDFATTLEEQLIGAACLHSKSPHIALLSPKAPGYAWRQIAKKFKKKLIHLPLSRFGDETVQQLRMVHVLNGKEVRSYAADFIRRV